MCEGGCALPEERFASVFGRLLFGRLLLGRFVLSVRLPFEVLLLLGGVNGLLAARELLAVDE